MTDEIRCDGIFDAKLIRENKSAKGIFLTLEIAADDYFAAKLSDVRPGALLKIGYQEIPNVSVEPIEVENSRGGVNPAGGTVPRPQADKAGTKPEYRQALDEAKRETRAHVETLKEPKPKRAFSDLPLSQQAALRCDEAKFTEWFEPIYYAEVKRRGQETAVGISGAESAVMAVRDYLDVRSRSELSTNEKAAAKWEELESMYQIYLLDQRYPAEARR